MLACSRPDALMGFYYRRLEHVRTRTRAAPASAAAVGQARRAVRCELGRYDDAVAAFEVALSLDPDNLDRRQRLADLYAVASPAPRSERDRAAPGRAARQHKQRIESYKALRTLYGRTHQPERAEAVDDALAILRAHLIDERIEALFERPPTSGAGTACSAAGAHARQR